MAESESPPSETTPFWKHPAFMGAVAAALITAIAGVVVTDRSNDPPPPPPTVTQINGTPSPPPQADLLTPINVPGEPDGVAVGRYVWVAAGDGVVTRIAGEKTMRIPADIGRALDSVAVGGGSVWVSGEAAGKVAQINEDSGIVERRVDVGGRPKGLAVGNDSVWVANCHIDSRSVKRIRLGSGATSSIKVEGYPRDVAVDSGRVYVAVRRQYPGCDPQNRKSRPRGFNHIAVLGSAARDPQFRSLLLTEDPTDVALTNRWLWVAAGRNKVLRVNPRTGVIDGRLTVASGLTAIAAGESGIWALSRRRAGAGSVTRIDPETLKNSTIDLDGSPQEIALGMERVWVTQKAGSVTPIRP